MWEGIEGPPKGRGKGKSLGAIRMVLGTGQVGDQEAHIFYPHEERSSPEMPVAAQVRGQGGYMCKGRISCGKTRLSICLTFHIKEFSPV